MGEGCNSHLDIYSVYVYALLYVNVCLCGCTQAVNFSFYSSGIIQLVLINQLINVHMWCVSIHCLHVCGCKGLSMCGGQMLILDVLLGHSFP